MPFITDLREQIIKGEPVRRKAWPANIHIRLFDVQDNRLRKIGTAMMLFTPIKNNTDWTTKNYTPVWPEIVADDWELYIQQ